MPHCPPTSWSNGTANPFLDEPSDCEYFFWLRRDPGTIIGFALLMVAVVLVAFAVFDSKCFPQRTKRIVLGELERATYISNLW